MYVRCTRNAAEGNQEQRGIFHGGCFYICIQENDWIEMFKSYYKGTRWGEAQGKHVAAVF